MSDRKRMQGLPERERAALTDFIGRLRRQFSADLIHSVWVFGSTIRGTADEESDIDLLIVMHDYTWELEKAITRLAVEVDLAHDVVLSDHVIDRARYAQMASQGVPLYHNIREEGIDLWQIETQPIT
jgi:predicted nucleotidyltransferase